MHLEDSLRDHLQDRPWLIKQIINDIPKKNLIAAAQTMGTKGAELSSVMGYISRDSNILGDLGAMSGVAAGGSNSNFRV